MVRWYITALPAVLVCGVLGFFGGVIIRGMVRLSTPDAPVGALPYLMAFLFGGGAFVVLAISISAGEFMRRITTGGPMRPSPQYSYPDSLVARGMYEGAVTAYREAIEEEQREGEVDAEPYLRVARLYRDHLKAPDKALEWFEQARRARAATRDQVNMATRVIVDIHLHGTGDPSRAIPELARLAEQAAGSKIGDLAARRLADLKQELAWTIKDQARSESSSNSSSNSSSSSSSNSGLGLAGAGPAGGGEGRGG